MICAHFFFLCVWILRAQVLGIGGQRIQIDALAPASLQNLGFLFNFIHFRILLNSMKLKLIYHLDCSKQKKYNTSIVQPNGEENIFIHLYHPGPKDINHYEVYLLYSIDFTVHFILEHFFFCIMQAWLVYHCSLTERTAHIFHVSI